MQLFTPDSSKIEVSETCFFDIVTTQYDHPRCVKHVLGRIYVFFTLFGNQVRGGGGGGYVTTLPTCGSLLILPPALKPWGPPRQQGLCSHLAHLWATSESAPRFEAVGTPQAAGVM